MSDHRHGSALEADTSPNRRLSAVIARACVAALVIFSTGFVTLMIIGVIRFWHPLPHWDMWGGYVAFWLRLTDGDWSTFWELHNEHRIVLTRLVFWVDFAVFKGAGWFLLASSAVLALTIAATFIAALRWRLLEARSAIQPMVGFALLATLTTALTTSWLQNENLTWGFQVQFFLAVLIPLLALLAVGRAARGEDLRPRHGLLWIGLGLSVLSIGTIASGVLTPWLAALFLALRRFPRRWIVLYFLVAAVLTVAYTIGFKPTWNGSNPIASLQTDPVGVLAFLLAFLGAPIGQALNAPVLAIGAGTLFVVLVVTYFIRQTRSQRNHGTGLALVLFAVFIIGWGVITATGRLRYGLDYAWISRYTTPVLAGWASLVCLSAPRFQRMFASRRFWVAVIPLGLLALLCVPQTQTLSSNAVWHDSRNSTALALALGIPDRQVMYMHVWAPKYSIRLTDRLRADQLTLFGRPPLRDLQHNLGQTSAGLAEIPCTGNLDSVDGIQLSDWRRVSGSVSPATPIGEEFQLVQILDPARKVVGYATLIEEQSDNASGTATSPTRFIGYIAAGTQTDGLTLADRRWVCSPALRRTP